MKARPPRAGEIAARKRAFDAARLVLNEKRSLIDAARTVGSTKGGVHEALTVLQYGTETEIAGVENNTLPMSKLSRAIRARVPVADRPHRVGFRSAEQLDAMAVEAAIYAKLRNALDILTGLPQPADVVAIAHKSRNRRETLNSKLIAAYGWITEFSDAWTK